MIDTAQQIQIVRRSSLFDARWYLASHPEVALAGLDPAAHYVTEGAARGLDPGPCFVGADYLRLRPDAVQSGMVPLVDWLVHGLSLDLPRSWAEDPDLAPLWPLRHRLLTLGLTAPALAGLRDLALGGRRPGQRAVAAMELALWHMAARTPDGWREARGWIARAQADAIEPGLRDGLGTAQILACAALGDIAGAEAALAAPPLRDAGWRNATLARANAEADPHARLRWFNAVLDRLGLAALDLRAGSAPAFDRLAAAPPSAPVTDGPLVSVLVAAHACADTLPTALRSLRAQTWRNLEILVVDDASPDAATGQAAQAEAARDPRIRVLRLAVNGGAYVARNAALAVARGEHVTLLDADDWAHPEKIARQMQTLRADPALTGTLSDAPRIADDLSIARWVGGPWGLEILRENTSSLLVPRAITDRVGPWDTVRFGADSERLRRIRAAFGPHAVHRVAGQMLGLSRLAGGSAVADPAIGIDGFLYGARAEYHEAEVHHAQRAPGAHRVTGGTAPAFPVPRILRADRAGRSNRFDVVMAGDFRIPGAGAQALIDEVAMNRRAGLRTGLVQLPVWGADVPPQVGMLRGLRDLIDGEGVSVIVHGEAAVCDLLVLCQPAAVQYPSRYRPKIDAGAVRILVDSPPAASDLSGRGLSPWTVARCDEGLADLTATRALWQPTCPATRAALLAAGLDTARLAPGDWVPVLDPRRWLPPQRSGPAQPGTHTVPWRIGRHRLDRDADDATLMAGPALPPGVDLRLMGGARHLLSRRGSRPVGWQVLAPDAQDAVEFLAGLDVYLAPATPGRGWIEAMAMALPVVLPAKSAPGAPDPHLPCPDMPALQAEPGAALAAALGLRGSPDLWRRLSQQGQQASRRWMDPAVHLDRLFAAGVRCPGRGR